MVKILSSFVRQRNIERRSQFRNALIRYEAKLGGRLFGPVQHKGRREFFCLDKYTWVWYEEWTDQQGKQRSVTTRYDVRPHGVLKSQQGHASYQTLTPQEARNFQRAVNLYAKTVDAEYRRMLGHPA